MQCIAMISPSLLGSTRHCGSVLPPKHLFKVRRVPCLLFHLAQKAVTAHWLKASTENSSSHTAFLILNISRCLLHSTCTSGVAVKERILVHWGQSTLAAFTLKHFSSCLLHLHISRLLSAAEEHWKCFYDMNYSCMRKLVLVGITQLLVAVKFSVDKKCCINLASNLIA